MPDIRMSRFSRGIKISFNSKESAEATKDRFRYSGYTDLSIEKSETHWILRGTPPPKFGAHNQFTHPKDIPVPTAEFDDWDEPL